MNIALQQTQKAVSTAISEQYLVQQKNFIDLCQISKHQHIAYYDV
jgi:hypothetical protein